MEKQNNISLLFNQTISFTLVSDLVSEEGSLNFKTYKWSFQLWMAYYKKATINWRHYR